MPPIPKFYVHSIGCTVFEQDMGLLSSQNELLVKANRGVKDLYLPLKSSDGWVIEYRKWLDKVRTLFWTLRRTLFGHFAHFADALFFRSLRQLMSRIFQVTNKVQRNTQSLT